VRLAPRRCSISCLDAAQKKGCENQGPFYCTWGCFRDFLYPRSCGSIPSPFSVQNSNLSMF